MSRDPTAGEQEGSRMLHTSGSVCHPHRAGVRRQLHAPQPELRFLCCCKNKVLRGERKNWHKKEQSLFPALIGQGKYRKVGI